MILFLSLTFIAGAFFIWFIFLMVTGLVNKNKTRILLSAVALIFTIVLSSWSAYLLLSNSHTYSIFLSQDKEVQTFKPLQLNNPMKTTEAVNSPQLHKEKK